MHSEYNHKTEYEDYVKAKVRELHVLCRQYKIPFYMTFALESDNEKTEYYSVAAMPPSMGLDLKEDRFRKFVLLENNFDVIPHKRTALRMQTFVNAEGGTDEVSDEELVSEALKDYEAEGEALTDEEKAFVEENEKATNASRKRGLGRPPGTTKEVMEKKRKEAKENGYKTLIESAYKKGKKEEEGEE